MASLERHFEPSVKGGAESPLESVLVNYMQASSRGRAKSAHPTWYREPGIHNPSLWVWFPGSPDAGCACTAPRNDGLVDVRSFME